MAQDVLKGGREGRFYRGNLHCHSNRSDGLVEPEEVVGAYRESGYDFLCLSGHFEEEYGWQVVDTRRFCDGDFVTIPGAELTSAPWDDRNYYWVVASGLPLDFAPPPVDGHAEAIRRARDAGRIVPAEAPAVEP